MDVVFLMFTLAVGAGLMAAFVISFVFVVSGKVRGRGPFLVLEAVRPFAMRMGQAGDLGRREQRRNKYRGEYPAICADIASSDFPDHTCPAVKKSYQ
jgi:hypothetical protein